MSLLAIISIFLDLIYVKISLEITLSPRFVVLNLSEIPNWIPFLVWFLVVIDVWFEKLIKLSWNVCAVVIGIPKFCPSFVNPPLWNEDSESKDVPVCDEKTVGPWDCCIPVQVVSQDPQSTGDNPVFVSTLSCCIAEL